MVDQNNTVQSIERALRILELIKDKGKLGIRDLSKLTSLSPSTVQRIVFTLEKNGYLLREAISQKCRLSHKFYYFSNQAVSQSRLFTLAVPVLEKLSLELDENIVLTTIDKTGTVICVANISLCSRFKNPIFPGNRLPPHSNAFGKAMLAYLPTEDVSNLLNALSFEAFTPNTITDIKSFTNELNSVRSRGYAISNREQYGNEITIAAPILDHVGVVGAFGINGLAERFSSEQILLMANIILRASRKINFQFGWQP